MDYEQKYKDALERARKELQACGTLDCDCARQMFRLFPELKESEDERIKKDLIGFFKDGGFLYHKKEEIVEWLKKQESVEEIVERCKTSWYNEGKIQGQIEGLSDEEKYQQEWQDALEKQDEQKSTWSEEDEERLRSCLNILQAKGIMGVTETINTKWLKSLKDRYTWKPSDKQLDALHDAAVYVDKSMFPYPKGILMKLYKQLKKLKGE